MQRYLNEEGYLYRIATGAGVTLLGSFLGAFIAFIYKSILSKKLGPEGFGLFTLGLTFLGFVQIISNLGLGSGVRRFIPIYRERGEKRKVTGILRWSFLLVFLSSTLLALVLFILSEPIAVSFFHEIQLQPVLKVFCLIMPFASLVYFLRSVFYAFERPILKEIEEVGGEKFLALILALIWLIRGTKVIGLSYSYFLAMALTVIGASTFLHNKIHPFLSKREKSEFEREKIFSFSLPLMFGGMFTHVYMWSDNIVLGFYKTAQVVGIYNVAYLLSTIVSTLWRGFTPVFYPVFTRLYVNGEQRRMSSLYQTVSRWNVGVTLPFLLFLILFRNEILLFLGQEYLPGEIGLIILSSSFFLVGCLGPAPFILGTYGLSKIVMIIEIFTAVMNVSLNIALIPKWGLEGAAIATGISFLLRHILHWVVANKLMRIKYDLRYTLRYIYAAVLSGVIIYLLISFGKIYLSNLVYLFLMLTLLLIFYLGFVYFFRAFKEEDKGVIREIKRRLWKRP